MVCGEHERSGDDGTKDFLAALDSFQLCAERHHGKFGKVDAGFHGTLTIGCFNASDAPVDIPIGDRFCQIVFENLSSDPKALYHERSGTYQNQRGVTLQR